MPWPLIGNTTAFRILSRAVDTGSVQHAYIFAGPEQTGRRTAGLVLAQALNCTADSRPCGECKQCRRISAGNHADIHIVEIEEATDGPAHKEIGVDQLRGIERAVALNPYEGRTRVVIVDPADMMSPAAQNAFLKTLEEPPSHVVIVLITTDESRLLETVRSRCARVPFRLVSVSEIEARLTACGTEPERAQLLARLSGGRPGWAIRTADDDRFFEARQESLEAARSLPQMPLPDRIELAEKLSESFRQDRQAVHNRINGWLDWWRDVVLAQFGAGDAVANSDRIAELQEDAGRWPREEVLAFVRSLIATREYLAANVQPKIALDALMLDVPGGGVSATPQAHR